MKISEITYDNLLKIKKEIDTELKKRCFPVGIGEISIKENNGNYSIQFESDEFNTVPSLFESIRIIPFNSYVSNKEPHDNIKVEYVSIVLSVSVNYNHYDLGSNSSKLFYTEFRIFNGESHGVKRIK
jgi:hypothetical protein